MVTVLYADTDEMRDRVAPMLGTAGCERTDTRTRFAEALRGANVGIAAITEVSEEVAAWIRGACNDPLCGRPCVVVAPLGIASVQQCRSFDASRLRVVWLEELEDRLPRVLQELRGANPDPLASLGERIIAEHQPRPVVTQALTQICSLGGDGQPPPPSVTQLARSLYITPSPLRRYWAADVPLRCGPKQLLKWALLFRAIEQRSKGDSWRGIAASIGTSLRTLQRNASEMAGCGLAAAARKPDAVRARFEAWVARVERDG